MNRLVSVFVFVILLACSAQTNRPGYTDTPFLPGQKWRVHDADRPYPRVVSPGARRGDPPSDAIVLFDGKDLSKWRSPKWTVEDGATYPGPGAGPLISNEAFGDIQLHLEFATPSKIEGSSQDRGNSGVIIMGHYEIQVLDSWENPTYADGQAAAIYGQWPPLVNASRKPGEWQAYDIIFEAPKFDGDKVVKPAFVTVLHNGVLMHHRKEILGTVEHAKVAHYQPHPAEEPLMLQDHNTLTRFRNIWVRRLTDYDQP